MFKVWLESGRKEEDKDDTQSSGTKLHSAQGRMIPARPPSALLWILCTQGILSPFLKVLTLWPFMLLKGYTPTFNHFQSIVVNAFKRSEEVGFKAWCLFPEENYDDIQVSMHPNLDYWPSGVDKCVCYVSDTEYNHYKFLIRYCSWCFNF